MIVTGKTASGGYALPIVFGYLLFVALLFGLSLNLTLAERGNVESYYYQGVALDLAESGAAVAMDLVERGASTGSGSFQVGEFRGKTGTSSYKVDKTGDGYRIVAEGRLSGKAGENYSSRVQITGRPLSKDGNTRFAIEQYRELPPD